MNKTNISAEPMLPLLRARCIVLDDHLGAFISHHRAHRLALLNSSSVTVRSIPLPRPAAPVTKNGSAMLISPAVMNAGVDHKSTITVALRRDVPPVPTAAQIR